MTGSAAAGTSSNARASGQADTLMKATGTNVTRGSRLPVDRLLPGGLLTELQRTAAPGEQITPKFVAELDRKYDIAGRFGVSRRRLRDYLQRRRPKDEGEACSNSRSRAQDDGTNDGWSEKVCAHRRRQASVAAILDQTFGKSSRCGPELWERRAYLMLVGLVYERLATNEDEITTEELVTLAKALAENRRVEARLREQHPPEQTAGPKTAHTGALPDNFADVVRQVYGTNLQMPEGEDRARD